MEQQEKPDERVEIYNYFQGAHINNIVINGTMNKGGDNINNHEEKQNSTSYNDEQVAEALSKIVGKGKPIDCKWKWAGAIWLLQWVCLYPKNTKEACERINSLPLPDDLEYECEYRNVRELTTLSFFSEDARHLENVRCSKNDEVVFQEMTRVVRALTDELRKTIKYRTCVNM